METLGKVLTPMAIDIPNTLHWQILRRKILKREMPRCILGNTAGGFF
jgi:hypothetical protein